MKVNAQSQIERQTMAGISGSLILTVCAQVLSLLFHLPLLHGKTNPEFRLFAVEPQPVFEDGYTITTVIDGHKLHINPHSVLLRPRSSDLIVLDTSRSSFYTLPFPIAQGNLLKVSNLHFCSFIFFQLIFIIFIYFIDGRWCN